MTLIQHRITRLRRSQLQQVHDLLTIVFEADPILHYITPEAGQTRSDLIQWLCSVLLYRCRADYQIYTTAEIEGVAIWRSPKVPPLSLLHLIEAGLLTLSFQLSPKGLQRCLSLSTVQHYCAPRPCWSLLVLGVLPSHLQGITKALLQPVLIRADVEKIPCWTEATTVSSMLLFQSCGFEIIETQQLQDCTVERMIMQRNSSPFPSTSSCSEKTFYANFHRFGSCLPQ